MDWKNIVSFSEIDFTVTIFDFLENKWSWGESNSLPTGLQPDALPMSYNSSYLIHKIRVFKFAH